MTSPLTLELPDGLIDQVAELVAARLAETREEPWINVAEAALHLGCSESRVYALKSAAMNPDRVNPIPFAKDGSRPVFKRSELDAGPRAPS